MKHLNKLVLIFILMLSFSGITAAQGGMITYGETRTEMLTAEAPQALYNLQGNANEVLTVYVLGWVDGFQPTITILGPTGQIGFSSSDALTPIMNDARVTAKLPQAGNYSILVSSASPIMDMFTIAIRNTTPGISTQLSAEPVTINIPPGGESLTYSIPASPSGDIPLTVASTTPGFMFAGHISAPDGRILVAFDGALSSVTTTLPVGSDMYTLVVRSSDPVLGGALTVAQSGVVPSSASTPSESTSSAPATSSEIPATNLPEGVCVAVAGANGTNVRTGPGTNYDILRTLVPNEYLTVTGQNMGWYSDGIGWVAGSVITLYGPCDAIPMMDYDMAQPAATQAPNDTAVATATTANNNTGNAQPTATTENVNTGNAVSTATATATIVATATATATIAPTATQETPVAAQDGDYTLRIPRDGGGAYANEVSYPNGDTSDRIFVKISDLSNQSPNSARDVTIFLTCAGEGIENVSWTSSTGSNRPLACNESVTVFHGYQSNNTSVVITMDGPGYVQYTLTAAASR